MGKKGKRSKRKATYNSIDKITLQTSKLVESAEINFKKKNLHSKAKNEVREAIRILESKKPLMIGTIIDEKYYWMLFSQYFAALMEIEYESCNYEVVLACFDQHILPYEYEIVNASKMPSTPETCFYRIKLFYLLSKLRKENEDYHEDGVFNCIEMMQKYEKQVFILDIYATSGTFVVLKRYNAAYRLWEKCTALPNKLMFISKLLLAKSYLELHRGEICQPDSTETYHRFHEMKALFDNMEEEHPIHDNDFSEYFLVLAQWYYLTHKLDEGETNENLVIASGCLKHFLGTSLGNSIFLSESKGACSTCCQAVTPTEVQYVCSGCRVACYCSIDHQRMTWKKEAVKGMRIGHEILCPLYKTYRKFSQARKNKDKEKESRMKKRFDRECIRFLADGLGLKNKCVPCEYKK
ncbi:predicted protein [Chaetoceros tenuissimus]|uniref:MYND-type domain-containing protein n=1 Tax=Chaetoceros tenuissimus TaxID=426638 RepID=A0AAD3D3I2_9STRA|nr:predicted protein [Chaetoceros tenuissimus]